MHENGNHLDAQDHDGTQNCSEVEKKREEMERDDQSSPQPGHNSKGEQVGGRVFQNCIVCIRSSVQKEMSI